ncbi:hypothetical protein Agub_g10237, partial [Astrephomene gubernaculifera]
PMQAIIKFVGSSRQRVLLPIICPLFPLSRTVRPRDCPQAPVSLTGLPVFDRYILDQQITGVKVLGLHTSTAMAAKAFTIGGIGAQPSLDDVVKIAQGGLVVALDAAGAERVKKESPAPKSFQPETFVPSPDAATPPQQLLDVQQTRAVLATRLLTVMNGRSGTRVQVADYLVEMLNKNILPALPAASADPEVLSRLADVCHGAGATVTPLPPSGSEPSSAPADGNSSCHSGSSRHPPAGPFTGPALSEALSQAGLTPPGLSGAERVVLGSGCCASAGVGALAVQGGKQLQSLATAVAALSCEALGVQTKSFEADVVEAQGYKGAVAAADELRGLLEGSKRVDTLKDKGAAPGELAPFTAAPQRLGALSEALSAAYTCVRSEVQSGALPPRGTAPLAAPSPLLPTCMLDLSRALLATARDSAARCRAVVRGVGGSGGCGAGAGGLEEQLSGTVEGGIAAAQAQMAAVGRVMMEDVDAMPG